VEILAQGSLSLLQELLETIQVWLDQTQLEMLVTKTKIFP
jgi:hypothetical protein